MISDLIIFIRLKSKRIARSLKVKAIPMAKSWPMLHKMVKVWASIALPFWLYLPHLKSALQCHFLKCHMLKRILDCRVEDVRALVRFFHNRMYQSDWLFPKQHRMRPQKVNITITAVRERYLIVFRVHISFQAFWEQIWKPKRAALNSANTVYWIDVTEANTFHFTYWRNKITSAFI